MVDAEVIDVEISSSRCEPCTPDAPEVAHMRDVSDGEATLVVGPLLETFQLPLF